MAVHVAIVQAPYDRLILDGRKDVECRLTKRPVPPFGRIVPGERIYFKRSAGPFFATAVVDGVWMSDRLTPAALDHLRQQYNDRIHGPAAYWQQRRDARYGTLIWLREVRPTALRPDYKSQNMRAWYTLDDAADPLSNGQLDRSGEGDEDAAGFELTLTEGMLRQRVVRVGEHLDRFPAEAVGGRTKAEQGEPIALHLEGGPVVWTDLVGRQKMFRWRGWGGWFQRCGLRPGARLRFVPDGGKAFYVQPVRGG
jgi:hypothetical protein